MTAWGAIASQGKALTSAPRLRSLEDQPTVAHFVSPYLFRTGSWIHGQILHMRRYAPVVLTERTENLDLFPAREIFAYEGLGIPRKVLLCLWQGRLNRIRDAYFEWTIGRRKVCLIHSHFGQSGFEMLNVKARTGLPMITSFYGADVSEAPRDPVWRRRYERLFAEGDLFLAEGSAMQRALVDLGCPPAKVTEQHLGVDLDALPFSPRRSDSSGMVRVLIAATFREKKGIPDALRAIGRVLRRCPNLAVTLIGDTGARPEDQEEKRTILRLVRELDGIVRWVGFQPPAAFRTALLAHHLFLSPSRTAISGDTEGGAPISIIEAQATGMPVISTVHADIPEVVVHDQTGLLSPEGDSEALAHNLERLATQPDLWEQMGIAARNRIALRYNVRTQIVRLEEIYASLTRRANP